MRFPRNAKIFRGQLDTVPLMGVLFLLLIFILLGSLIYTPGIPFELEDQLTLSNAERRVLTISRSGEIVFNGRTNRIENLDELRREFRKLPSNTIISINADPNAPRQLVVLVRDQAKSLPITLETSNVAIELPEATAFAGTANARVVVAVNLGGQFFYENRLMQPNDLKLQLSNLVQRTTQPLTLIVMADKSTETEVLLRLGEMARQVGINRMVQATRPAKK